MLKILVASVSVVSSLYLLLAPNISIETTKPLDPMTQAPIQFTISNNGKFSVRDVKFSCRLRKVVTEKGNTFRNVELHPRGELFSTIKSGEKAIVDIELPYTISDPPVSIDMEFIFTCHQDWWPFTIEKTLRYKTGRLG